MDINYIGSEQFAKLREELEDDQDRELLETRIANDDGERHSLEDVREELGIIEPDDDFEAMLDWLDDGLEASLDKDQFS